MVSPTNVTVKERTKHFHVVAISPIREVSARKTPQVAAQIRKKKKNAAKSSVLGRNGHERREIPYTRTVVVCNAPKKALSAPFRTLELPDAADWPVLL